MAGNITKLNHKTWIWIGLFLSVFLFVGLGTLIIPHKPTPYPPFLTESSAPSGVKAFYTLLANRYDQVGIWKKPVEDLPYLSSNQLMIIAEPFNTLDNKELQQWIDWVKAGNRIWFLDDNPKGYFPFKTTWAEEEQTDSVRTIYGSNELKGRFYQAEIHTNIRLISEPKDQILLRDQSGILAMSRMYGKGEIMVLLTPDWMTNDLILNQDHLELILPFIQHANSDIIWFNDFVHGNESRLTLFELYPEWFLFFFIQGAIALLLWLWYKGKRFGPIHTPREWTVRFGDERIRAIAAWHERGGFYQESLSTQVEFLKTLLQEKWGIPTTGEVENYHKILQRYLSPDQQKQWLLDWQELKSILETGKISHKDYLKWSLRLENMRKEVEHE